MRQQIMYLPAQQKHAEAADYYSQPASAALHIAGPAVMCHRINFIDLRLKAKVGMHMYLTSMAIHCVTSSRRVQLQDNSEFYVWELAALLNPS